MGVCIGEAMHKHDLTANQVYDAGVMDKATIRNILKGEHATATSYNILFGWLEKNKPEIYNEAVHDYIKKLNELIVDKTPEGDKPW